MEVALEAIEVSDALMAMGNPFRAAPLYAEAYGILEKEVEPSDLRWALINERYGRLGRGMGTPKLADSYFRKALAIRESLGLSGSPETIELRHRLADLLALRGEYEEARSLHEAGLAAQETARGLRGMSFLFQSIGDYAQAEEYARRAVRLKDVPREKALTLARLGEFLRDVGDLKNSEKILREAHQMLLDTLGPEHVDTAGVGEGLGLTLAARGQFEEARKLIKHSYHTHETWLAIEHPSTQRALDNLAITVVASGDLSQAKAFYQLSVEGRRMNFGNNHLLTAQSRRSLADIHVRLGEMLEARPLYQRALSAHKKELGLAHPETVQSFQQAAYYLLEKKNLEKALEFARSAEKGRLETLGNVFSFASERQRLRYYETLNPFDLIASLEAPSDILTSVLRYKGAVLDSVLEDTRLAESSEDPAIRTKVGELQTLRRLLLRKLLENSEATEVAELRSRVESLEKQLAHNTGRAGKPRRALAVKAVDVQNALPPDSVLVEFLLFKKYMGKGESIPYYGAVLQFPEGEPEWVSLGPAEKLDKVIRNYQSVVRGHRVSTRASRVVVKSAQLSTEEVLKQAYQLIWSPLESKIGGRATRLILSPDGQLNFVSFATLLDQSDKLLGETYVVTYVSSGRDLLAEFQTQKGRVIELFGDPKFAVRDTSKAPLAASRSVGSESIKGVEFLKLPYTLVECKSLRKMLRARGYKTRMYTSRKANEDKVRSVKSPTILHLATHGFFLPDDPEGGLRNPMHRSGLALTGAQTTIEAWAARRAPEPRSDGILTAQEVGLLQLEGTWLVALSACDTGSGESKPGQGVLGLRRGFVQAGTQNLLMTLWPVADLETSELMQDFYKLALSGTEAPLALASTQRDWLRKLREERGLVQAIRLAGPFVMTFQGS